MIIYNNTVKVNKDIHDGWLLWQKEEETAAIMNTGLFQRFECYRLLDQDDSEGPTYVLQYFTDSIEKYYQFVTSHARDLREKSYKKWGEKVIGFRSLLESVQ